MFKSGATVFLNLPSDTASGKALHRGAVVEFSSGGVTIAMDEPDVPVTPGQGAFLYYERQKTFMQQAVSVQAVMHDSGEQAVAPQSGAKAGRAGQPENSNKSAAAAATAPSNSATRLLVGLHVTGEPVSAEGRSAYRVVTSIAGGVTVTLDNNLECAVLDVSATGFSVISDAPLLQGQVVRVVIHHELEDIQGSAIVQSVKELAGGQRRIGLHCAGNSRSNGQLHRGLQRISAAVQRQQLRRARGE